MKNRLLDFLFKQSFQPNLLSIIINPFYLNRRNLFKNIKNNSHFLCGKILDFGCGRKPYKNLFRNSTEYIGLDIEVSGHPHKNSQIDIYYDGKSIPFSDEYFDAVFCSEVIEHLFNVEEILPELYRVMKKGGVGLFTFPFSWPEHEAPYDFARYTSFSSKSIFEKNNFQIIHFNKSGKFIEVIFQYFIYYFFLLFNLKNKKITQILIIPFTFSFNIIGLILSFILPNFDNLYFTNIVIVKKL